jgi:hypothetical protein
MDLEALFDMADDKTPLELIYAANINKMPAKDLGEAIIGMTMILKIAGRAAAIDFEDVYVYPIQEGSVKTLLVYVKRNKNKLIAEVGVLVVGAMILNSFDLIGKFGIAALKNPEAEVMTTVDKKVLELCMNADYRKSVSKIARPVNEENERVTIKVSKDSYEITRENQYKFITEDEEPILPELRNGETVNLVGRLTRMNMENNDLGFDYHGRKLSIYPSDPEKHVAIEYHEFTPMPLVVVTGIVTRNSDYEAPRLKVIKMDEFKPTQENLFEESEAKEESN